MFAEKLKYLQGYVRVQLTGYAPERFLNLCSNRNILIWNLEYKDEHYEFCISVKGFKQLKPLLRKTKTRLVIKNRYGFPFFLHRYRKRKLFFAGILLCACALYAMSLFIWNIEVQGNLHRTDSTIIKFLEENEIGHGILKSRLNCSAIEEMLRSQYDDVIWASVKIQGTRLIIDIQENLISNQAVKVPTDEEPSDLVAEKDAEIYSIITRRGTPYVKAKSQVKAGDILVEGKMPIYNDSGEIINYQYCYTDADILAITQYTYQDAIAMEHKDKTFTGQEKNSYQLLLFQKLFRLPLGNHSFVCYDKITTEYPLKIGRSFYLPVVLYKEVSREYILETKRYSQEAAQQLAEKKLQVFCEKLQQKGVQIIENNVIIVTEEKKCVAQGTIKVIEPIGVRRATTITEIQQEGHNADESDGENN